MKKQPKLSEFDTWNWREIVGKVCNVYWQAGIILHMWITCRELNYTGDVKNLECILHNKFKRNICCENRNFLLKLEC